MVLRGSHLSSLSFRIRVCHPNTRIYVRLLGPCFKTGRLEPFRQHPKRWCGKPTGLPRHFQGQHAVQESWFKRQSGTQITLHSSVQSKAEPQAVTLERIQATFLRLFTSNQTDVGLLACKCTTRDPCGTCN